MTLAPATIGIGLSMLQVRALAIAAPAIPFLAGFVLARIVAAFAAGHQRAGTLLGLVATLFVFLPQVPLAAALGLLRPERVGETTQAADSDAWQPLARTCRSQKTLDWLAGLSPSLPPGSIILSELNFGTMILAHTPYSATSAGYHRSGDAFLNGVVPFQSEAGMVKALHKTKSDYVVVCRDDAEEQNAGVWLLSGELPPWLVVSEASQPEILLLQVDKARLEMAWQALPRSASGEAGQ